MLICANALRIPLPDESVQCVVTSPPYWGLRRYAGEQEFIWTENKCKHVWTTETEARELRAGAAMTELSKSYRGGGKKASKVHKFTITRGVCKRCGAWKGAFGLEPTVEMYVDHTIQILREIRRVLRKDGAVFWNIGDSYCSGAYSPRVRENPQTTEAREKRMGKDRTPHNWTIQANKIPRNGRPEGLKPKDLVLMPARIALAAQADGWYVRSMIIWAKPNPMPESVSDRPADSYEHIILLSKSERYFWDADAVREPAEWDKWGAQTNKKELVGKASIGRERTKEEIIALSKSFGQGGYSSWRGERTMPNETRAFGYVPKGTHPRGTGDGGPKAAQRGSYENLAESTREVLTTRNMRNVWMFATQPYDGAHFATFPEELPRRCIKAATSELGACRFCGAPWRRVVEKIASTMNIRVRDAKRGVTAEEGYAASEEEKDNYGKEEMGESRTIGWSPTCKCKGQHRKTKSCIVLDPFGGSGTTGRVAIELNRTPVLLDVAYSPDSPEHYADLARQRTTEVQRGLSFV